ncbi:MAG: ribosome-binding factor A [Planctomycetes bacterium]|nr:ribosome-binding factor A [Planctomycetota bacterium]
MSRKKPSRKDMRPLCLELGPEDGLDPRLAPRDFSSRGPGRKVLQLCGEVARTLNGAFADSADEVLRDLAVVAVTPAPNSTRLLVTVGAAGSGRVEDAERVLERLHQAAARLRTEVAAAINRRRVPELSFRVLT